MTSGSLHIRCSGPACRTSLLLPCGYDRCSHDTMRRMRHSPYPENVQSTAHNPNVIRRRIYEMYTHDVILSIQTYLNELSTAKQNIRLGTKHAYTRSQKLVDVLHPKWCCANTQPMIGKVNSHIGLPRSLLWAEWACCRESSRQAGHWL